MYAHLWLVPLVTKARDRNLSLVACFAALGVALQPSACLQTSSWIVERLVLGNTLAAGVSPLLAAAAALWVADVELELPDMAGVHIL